MKISKSSFFAGLKFPAILVCATGLFISMGEAQTSVDIVQPAKQKQAVKRPAQSQAKKAFSQKNVIEQKLKSTIIPSVSLKDATMEDAVNFLRRQSVALDKSPEGTAKGINFVISSRGAKQGSAAAEPATKVVIPDLQLRNVPMYEVVRFIADMSRMQFRIEDHAVVFYPPG